MVIRFRDYGKRLADFEQEIIVRCPLGWHNGSLASRLPRWIELTQHREKVLQKIQQLKHRL
ncbi:hypothetical protein [Nostoc sp.]|uniref:hypothetical protein n=1 Tax=Nostoc sp. TaxID=1180 RepID=UPI002FFB8311